MIVDLAAENCPVEYQSDEPSDLLTNKEYKITKLVLRRIPAGTFTMGSPVTEKGRRNNEIPHQVSLTRDYYMGVFEVTQGQWKQLMGSNPSYYQGRPPANDPTYYDRLPVESITWESDIRGGNWPPK